MNSELLIKTKIWKKENFELVDYLSDDIIIISLQEIISPNLLLIY